jgi:hypothetical protein
MVRVSVIIQDWWPTFLLPAMLGGPLLIGGAVALFRHKRETEVSSPWPLRLVCVGAGLCLPVLVYIMTAFSGLLGW